MSAKTINTLFVSVSLPPFPDSQAIRSAYLSSRLAELEFRLTFVSPQIPGGGDATLQDLIPAHSNFIRTPPTRYDRVVQRLSRQPGGKKLAWIYSNVLARLAAPDVRAGWQNAAVAAARNLPEQFRPDVVMSGSGSSTAHIAALQLSRIYGVPWVADFGDPWWLGIYDGRWDHAVVSRRNRRLEAEIMPQADGLVFTTQETLEAYRNLLGAHLPRAIHIPSGYRESDFDRPDGRCGSFDGSGPIHLTLIGVTFRDRDLNPSLQALRRLETSSASRQGFIFGVAGPHSPAFEQEAAALGLRSVAFEGRINYRESIDRIQRSDALIAIGNKGPLQVPGKLFIYLASGKPVIYVRQRLAESDPGCRLMSAFPGVLVTENQVDSIAGTLRELEFNFAHIAAEAQKRPGMESLRQYESRRIGDLLADFMQETIREHQNKAQVRIESVKERVASQ